MKPNFALNLSHDGIDLLHRGSAGWQPVGTVDLEDPDLGAGLEMLRRTAAALDAGGLATKVIIPDSQILYTEVVAGGADRATREANIRKALVGLTPYPVEDLVFDWRAEGDRVKLAVLARATVAEAETFAREHRFNPVSFAAAPEAGRFPGEPFFGTAASAADLLKGRGPVEPDDAPIDLDAVRRARRAAQAADEGEGVLPQPAVAVPEASDAEAAGETVPAAEAAAAAPDAPNDDPLPEQARPEAPPAPFVEAEPEAEAAPVVSFTSRRQRRQDRLRAAEPAADIPDAAAPDAAPPAAAVPPVSGGAVPDDSGAPSDLAEPEAMVAAPPEPAPPEGPTPAAVPETADRPEADAPDRPRRPRLVASSQVQTGAPPVAVPSRGSDRAAAAQRLAASAAVPAGALRAVAAEPPRPRRNPVVDFRLRRDSAEPAAELPDPAPEPDLPEPAMAPAPFAGLRPQPSRRSPTVVVVLTLVLLAALAAVALWSTFWTGGSPVEEEVGLARPLAPGEEMPSAADEAAFDGEPDLPQPDSQFSEPAAAEAAPDEPAAGDPPAAALPEAALPDLPADPAAAVLGEVADAPVLPQDDAAALGPAETAPDAAEPTDLSAAGEAAQPVEPAAELDSADPAAEGPATPALPQDPMTELVGTDEGAAERVREQLAAELTPEIAARRYDATGVWVMAPLPPAEPGQGTTEDLYLAAVDPVIGPEDAVALPPAAADKALLSPLPPPPAGTTFDFDENGLVRATPEGALNPDGIPVILGRPPVAPAPRPGTIAAPPVEPVPAAGAPDAGTQTDAPAGPRPRPRPADLNETTEKAQLGGRTRAELARLQPRQRPGSIVTLAAAVAAPGADAEPPPGLAPATDLAVVQSRTPRQRPAEVVAVAAAARIAPPPPQPAAPPPATQRQQVPEDDGEVAVAAAAVAAPRIPSSAGVAKTATVKNAINLSKMNLIGVYGTPSQRRALVRMSNGKYVKVKIGDRIDGGRVAAIGDKELIYTKGGRQVRLELPKT